MGNTGTVEQFSFKRRSANRPSDGNDFGNGWGGTGQPTPNADNARTRGRRTESIGVESNDSAGSGSDGIGGRIFGNLDAEAQARHLGEESPDASKRRSRPKGTRGRSKEEIDRFVTGEMVKKYTVSTFNLIGNLTKRPHWRVTDAHTEIDPWSDDAATLINALPDQYAMAFSKYGAGFAVALGLGAMVAVRVRIDGELAAQNRQVSKPKKNPNADRLITDEDIRATRQPYTNGHVEFDPVDIVIPTSDGVPMSADSLNKLYQYQQMQVRAEQSEEGTPHNFGKGGAEPLTPKDMRGIGSFG